MEEVWKDIYYTDSITGELIDYRGYYQVSNFGRVRSVDRYVKGLNGLQHKKGKILSLSFNKKRAYFDVGLRKETIKRKYCLVHRLVAHMFIPNPNNLPDVNHKDENKQNNMCTNLEWCTKKYNVNYGTCLERRAKSQTNDPLRSYSVNKYTMQGEYIDTYPSIAEAHRQNPKAAEIRISGCCQHKPGFYSAGGYRWEYIKKG